MRITMIGHSTVLIETGGLKILTDPYFGTWGNIAYARLAPPARKREEFPDVNLVLISHNHWDPTDYQFLHFLGDDVSILSPSSSVWLNRLIGVKRIFGMKTWEKRHFGRLTVTAVPALHIVATRGYVVESDGKCIYFAGDTYYGSFMREIGQRFQLDVALMPVTTFRVPMTMVEKNAVHAVQELKPSAVIPIHLGVQPHSPLLRTNHTVKGFIRRVEEAGLNARVINLREGKVGWLGNEQTDAQAFSILRFTSVLEGDAIMENKKFINGLIVLGAGLLASSVS